MSQREGLSHILWKINECLKPPIRKIVSLIKVQTLSIYVQHLLIMFSPHVNQCFTVNPAFDSLFPYLVSSETHESIIFPITYKPTQLSGIVWGDHLVYNTAGLLGLLLGMYEYVPIVEFCVEISIYGGFSIATFEESH